MTTKKFKALIVDDSRTAYMVLARMLSNYNIEAIYANSGERALAYLKDHQVDVIFLDQAMPGKDGIETIKEIKSSSNADTPVVMFTARTGDDYLHKVRQLGAEGVLPKELTVEDVEEVLQKLKLWTPKASQPAGHKVQQIVSQPSVDEKLKVWLESFLENQFSPQLSSKVRKATDDLRRDTIHYGKRMLDEIAKTDKQQVMIKEVKGQTDYLKELFATSFKQYQRISRIFIVLLVMLSAGLVWQAFQLNNIKSEQQRLRDTVYTLATNVSGQESRIIQEVQQQTGAIERYLQKDNQQSSRTNRRSNRLFSEQGDEVEIVGITETGRLITALSRQGYLFQIAGNGRIENNRLKQYYLQENCSGPAYVEAIAGTVLRVGEATLGYTKANSEAFAYKPVSWIESDSQCSEYQQTDTLLLREFLVNDEAVTGVADQVYMQKSG
ncbi:hypothetical protein CW740_11645 [Kangiella profundi]|uniref:Uncharacterized protein n=1 Tax=Kangiella profundi TaxID=1561924 RepID=A0A2K9AHL3_9GAMM|nr:response regulator [Kangiella profundi]AUD79866.1 hypothetical protein CW740_11645 [Kangiella profundi]GGE94676.1 hypothetical protein GCM10011356_05820 [Kangiella profundi]